MTIKALEELVGMTRANIRFYEQEGLLTPARLENGYRDYSETDAAVLRKIKLFRQLHLDLDTIRKLQGGELTLTQALAAQLTALEQDQAALDRARQVCEELRDAGEDWATLDPQPWLEKLERPPVPASPRYAPPVDIAPPPDSTLYPWRRFFAREIDLMLCGLIWSAFALLVLRWNPESNVFVTLFNGYVGWALLFLFEPLFLHRWGTTPGKALFAISIRDAEGNKLTWKQALRRTWAVFGKGYGWNIPIYSLWRLWKSYKQCQDGTRDEEWEGCLKQDGTFVWESYRVADGRTWRCVACAGVYAAHFLLIILIAFVSIVGTATPPNRGGLTEAEFYENCNFYMDYLDLNGGRLDESGHLVEPESSENTIGIITFDSLQSIDTVFSVVLTDGTVTDVTVTRQAETDSGLWVDNTTYQSIAVMALMGSLPELNSVNLLALPQRVTEDLVDGHAWNYTRSTTLTRGAQPHLETCQTTTLVNFEDASDGVPLLTAKEGKTARFSQEFTVTLTGA